MRTLSLLAAFPLLVATGCDSSQEDAPPTFDWRAPTDLEIDPLDDVTIVAWWSNDRQMLHLAPDGSFALYDEANPYRPPAQRGRWSQPSYAWIRLEPYSRYPTDPVRVSLMRVDGEIALAYPRLAPMLGLPGPPEVLEDHFLGRWTGSGHELRLGSDGRYHLLPRTGDGGSALGVGHRGRWRVDGARMRLDPDATGIDPVILSIRREGDAHVLDGPEGTWRRATPAAEPPEEPDA